MAILQRSPAIRVAVGAAEAVLESPVGSLIKAAAASFAALGAVDSVAGATTYTLSTGSPGEPSPLTVMEGSNIGVAFALVANPPTQAAPESWTITGAIPPGMEFGVNGDFITSPGFVNTSNPILEGTPTTPGTYTMQLQAWEGPNGMSEGVDTSSATFTYQVIVTGAAGAPAFTTQPISVTVAGGTVALDSVATNSPAYQWFVNGSTPVAGATGATLLMSNAVAGSYTCVATNSAGSATSVAATVTVSATASVSRLTNLSARADVGMSPNILFAGFASGPTGQVTGSQTVLIRASGPALALPPFNLSGTLPDPELQMFAGTVMFDSNTGWGGKSQIASLAAAVGAFSWGTAPTKDSALIETVGPGPYTAQVSGASGDAGLSIAEIYDNNPFVTDAPSTPRLVNLSARAQVGAGANILYGGFTIGGGATARTVLLRASGPALIPLQVTGTLPDPQVVLVTGSGVVLAANAGWGANPQIIAEANSVGAFPWGGLPTKDSALLITLPAGSYTAQVSGVSGDSGQAIIEVYEIP
jgi:hypothetical protein